MKAALFLLSLTSLIALTAPAAAFTSPGQIAHEPGDKKQIVVNNRILTQVNGRNISVLDVMKKMDLFLDKNYPELKNSPVQRFQFYNSQWRSFLTQLVQIELILADSESQKDEKFKVSEADIRQQIQERFQPNVMVALERIGMNYEEAKKMIHDEMLMDRMMARFVQTKAYFAVTPRAVESAYSAFATANPPKEEYIYQVVTVRAPDEKMGEQVAEKAYQLTLASNENLPLLPQKMKEKELINITGKANVDLNVSQEYKLDLSQLSESHKEVLLSLKPGETSPPIAQTSRKDNKTVYRIFHLKDTQKSETQPFELLQNKLRHKLLEHTYDIELDAYMKKLFKTYNYDPKEVDKKLPPQFQPFAIQ